VDDRVSLARADLVKGMLKWSVLFGDNNDDAPMVKYVLVNLGRMWTPASEIVGLYIYITPFLYSHNFSSLYKGEVRLNIMINLAHFDYQPFKLHTSHRDEIAENVRCNTMNKLLTCVSFQSSMSFCK